MPRIPRRHAPAKPPTLPCRKCKQDHPEDQTNHRMVEHTHLGRRCLGGDIPFAKHAERPMGKLIPFVRPVRRLPNRDEAARMAAGYIPQWAIARVLAEPFDRDFHPLFWTDRMMLYVRIARLDEEAAQPRPKVRVVRERRAGA